MKPPTLEEVQNYCLQRRNNIDPEAFIAFYEANGWVQGRGRKPIKNWKACVITWEKLNKEKGVIGGQNFFQRISDRSWAD